MTEKTTKTSFGTLLPVLFGFFVMGFADVVGIATKYTKETFNLSQDDAGLIPMAIFVWFFFLSIPSAILMNRIGRKNTVQLSNLITIVGMVLPLVSFNFISCLVAFALLGIGNTILQVALNPLMTNVVKGNALSSSLTTGQLIKAVSAFVAPFLAIFFFRYFDGNWQYIFPFYAAITLLSSLWLMLTPIARETPEKTASFGASLGMLGNKMVLLCFLGIFFVVGVDVGINTLTPELLTERAAMSTDTASIGSSIYFLGRTIGALLGAWMLTKMADMKYFRIHIVLAAIATAALFFVNDMYSILITVALIGYSCSSMFSVIFSQAIKARPEKANEISGLMVSGIVGGAVVAFVGGLLNERLGSDTLGYIILIGICVLYLAFFSIRVKTKN